ncbi:MAG: 3-dehydroquinate synthase II [Candidatus Lokiarchaeota archaeon]|nr:3-dehydroquinate synthase II [Candidatus Lokiarchaeota archaeon]
MKKIILKYDKSIKEEEFNELFQAALNYGIFNIFVDETYKDKISAVERIDVYSENVDDNPNFLVLNEPNADVLKNAIEKANKENYFIGGSFQLSNKEDEKKIIKIAKTFPDLSFIIAKATDWKIIPFENLIAELSTEDVLLYADVDSVDDAKLLLKTLERGVDGVIFKPKDANEILDMKTITGGTNKLELTTGEIINIKEVPKADRVCVDTSSLLQPGEGMLVGSTAKGFVLVHAEVFDSEFVNSRPFRVNAGDVSAYILVPSYDEEGNIKTRTNYLSELKAGEDVIVSDVNGNIRIVTVGRVKIETRPMLLINLKCKRDEVEIPINIILQNAETIRVVKEDLTATSVVDLKKGDKILVNIGPGATHFGTTIKETIIEK